MWRDGFGSEVAHSCSVVRMSPQILIKVTSLARFAVHENEVPETYSDGILASCTDPWGLDKSECKICWFVQGIDLWELPIEQL